MSRSILQHVRGFTPVIDVVAEDVGFVTAAVYGVHWRFCQMEDGVSRAAMKTIAAQLDISDKTARRHTQKLCDRGYLEDLTPDVRNAPHVYRDTGLVLIEALVKARLDRESNLDADRLDSESNPVGQKVQPGWSESPGGLDLESNEDSLKKEEKRKKSKRELLSLWQGLQGSIQGLMDGATYQLHYARATPVSLEGSTLTVALARERSLAGAQRLNRRIVDAVEKQHGITLGFVADGGPATSSAREMVDERPPEDAACSGRPPPRGVVHEATHAGC